MASGIPDDVSNGVLAEGCVGDTVNSHTAEIHNAFSEGDILEPIAVVGFSSRFSQEATSQDSFWKMLAEKRCAMTEWPELRISLDAFYHPDKNRIDTVRALWITWHNFQLLRLNSMIPRYQYVALIFLRRTSPFSMLLSSPSLLLKQCRWILNNDVF